jgi:Family of unknown function (DUF6843)
MKTLHLGAVVILGFLFLLGFGIYRVLGKAVSYEIPASFHGWLLVQWEDPKCPPLRRQGAFLTVQFSPSGQFCTSNPVPKNLVYQKFAFLFPNGDRQSIRWNAHGRPGKQVWALGIEQNQKHEYMFVGDEHEDWNHFAKPAALDHAPQS